MEEIFLKKSKSKGRNYYKIFKRDPTGKDVYVRMAGTPEAILKKLVLLDELEKKDQRFRLIQDQLLASEESREKDQLSHNKLGSDLLEDEK